MSRPLLRAHTFVALACSAFGCASVLGIEDDPKDVVSALCVCDQATSLLGTSCESFLNHRLKTATPVARANWMKKYDSDCNGGCDCFDAFFHTPPTCTTKDDCALPACADCCTTSSGSNLCG